MASITVDQLQVLITANAEDLDKKLEQVRRKLYDTSDTTGKATGTMSDALHKVGGVATAALKVGVVGAVAAVAASIPAAVKRIDTLVAFPRVLEALGVSSSDAAKATETLSKKLTGLPTPLQEGAAGVQALVVAGLGIDDATETYLAFNNAVLAGGIESGRASAAFDMLNKALARGKFSAEEWDSVATAMPTAMKALQNETGLTSEGLRELYKEKPDQLMKDLQRLNKEGGGNMASLDKQAREATGGIRTAFDNMRNSITRGIEGIVRSIGDGGTDAAKLESGQRKISNAISATGKAFGTALEAIGKVVSFVSQHSTVFGTMAAAIGGATLALIAWNIALTAKSIMTAFSVLQFGVGAFMQLQNAGKLVAAAQWAINAAMTATPIGFVIVAITALVAGFIYLWNTSEGFRSFFVNMWNTILEAVQPVIDIFNAYLLPALQMVWGFIVNQFQKAWEDLKKAFEQTRQTLQPYIDQMKGPLLEILKAVGIAIAVAFIAPLALLVAAIIAVVTVIATVISAVARFIGWIANLYAELVKIANLIVGQVANSFSNAWSKITGVWSAAVGFFSGVVNGIRGAFSGIAGWFGSVFQSAWSAITGVFGKIRGYFSDRLNDIKSVFSPSALIGSGKALIDGLVKGISDGFNAAKDFVGGKMEELRGLFPFSPAKEGPFSGMGYTTYSGKALMEDFAKGIGANASKARNAAMQAVSGVKNEMSTGFNASVNVQHGFSDFTDSDNAQPLIINVGGERLVDTVIQGINGRSFLGGSSVINV